MKLFNLFGFAFALTLVLSSCVGDEDTVLSPYTPTVVGTDFEVGLYDNDILAENDDLLEQAGWRNYAQTGSAKWRNQYYSGNSYAEFSSYQSGDAVNIGWLITPPINMDLHEGEKFDFDVSQSYVVNAANSLQVLISTNYNGTDVEGANWQPLSASIPGTSATYFEFQDSGVIDLSSYTGTIYIAFKVSGEGTSTTLLDGSYQLDNVRVYY
ncbi:choice-of-anchor J domain-containing protein [Flavobacterium silvaticum]|uniref:DUF5017 domain-containing protein n=1 Tax=Flavobacterium silvaticum TaxID=1852020 RepID=A0A972JE84_9FLAO|nr:choice-of-anchor J domain-containing protein [Flavobacterium silvaticum]NMH26594.1 hypothetical protein [Flavobacterium silvaticum]